MSKRIIPTVQHRFWTDFCAGVSLSKSGDVSVQAQVLNLLNKLKKEYRQTYIFIFHDLSVVKFMSDRMAVMQNGHIVELNDADVIYTQPQTDYTKALIAAIPNPS